MTRYGNIKIYKSVWTPWEHLKVEKLKKILKIFTKNVFIDFLYQNLENKNQHFFYCYSDLKM